MLLFSEIRKIANNRRLPIVVVMLLIFNMLSLFYKADVSSSGIYKEITEELSGMDMDSQSSYIENKIETLDALSWIDLYVKMGNTTDPYYLELIDSYGTQYFSQEYSLHMSSYEEEIRLYESLLDEVNTIRGYSGFISSLEYQKESIDKVSVFSGDSYSHLVTDKVISDYREIMENQPDVTFYPQKGLISACKYSFSDLFIVVFALFIAGISITEEYNSGMLDFVRIQPRGRRGVAASKILSVFVYCALFTVIVYFSDFAMCDVLFGLGDLGRPVQSAALLMHCTLRVSVLEYILLFIGAKILALCSLIGAILLITFYCNSFIFSCFFTALTYFAQWLVFNNIKPNLSFSFLKYISIQGLLDVNSWLGGYQVSEVLGSPASVKEITCAAFIVLTGITVIWFILVFSSVPYRNVRYRENSAISIPALNSCGTIFEAELQKGLLGNGVAVMLIFFLIASGCYVIGHRYVINAKEYIYQSYMDELMAVDETERTSYIEKIKKEDDISVIYELEAEYSAGSITYEEYQLRVNSHYFESVKRDIFEECVRLEERASTSSEYELVYDTGYETLFCSKENEDLIEAIISCLLICVCVSGLGAMEKEAGMLEFLAATPSGISRVSQQKIKVVSIIAAVICTIVYSGKLLTVFKDYGMPGIFCGIESVEIFEKIPNIPIALAILLEYVVRLLSCMCIADVVLMISKWTGDSLAALMISTAVFCLPDTLALLGLDNANILSAYSVFALFGSILDLSSNWITVFKIICMIIFEMVFLMSWGHLRKRKIRMPYKIAE